MKIYKADKIAGWAVIGMIIIMILIFCFACSKPQFGYYTIPGNTSMVIPPISFETDTLKCRVLFHYNCLNTPDWNKLFLWGETVSFIWKGEGENIALGWCAGVYDDYSTEIYGRVKTVHPDNWYELMIVITDRASWYIDGKFAVSYSLVKMLNNTVSSGEMNGFVDWDMSYELHFK